jgi:hypothetical protein
MIALRARKPMAWIWHHHKQSPIPIWIAPLWQARRDDQNGYIICILRSPDERDMHKTSCGPNATHTRPLGDMLPHRSPCVHDTSSIQGNTPSTNHKPPRVHRMDWRAHEIQTGSKSYIHREDTQGPIWYWRKMRARGAHKVSADPWVWSNRLWGRPS